MRRSFAFLAAVGLACACTDLKRAEEAGPSEPDGGGNGEGGGSTEDGGGDPSDAGPDVGPPPVDFECSEPWITATKTKAECAPRQVRVIDDEGALGMDDISIARTPAGRVAIAFHAPYYIDEGEMRFWHFTPATPTYTASKIVRGGNSFYQGGYHVKLAASGPDVIHVLAHDVIDGTSGDLLYFRFVDGKEPFLPSPADVVVPSLQQKSEIALGVDATGNVLATARVTSGTQDSGAPIARLAVRRKPAGGAWEALPDLAGGLSPNDAPGVGAASVLFDATGRPNALYHFSDSQSGSQPRYHVYDGIVWTPRKTVDNATFDGLSGYSGRLAASGNQRIAAYFNRKAQQGITPTADLRVARWSGANDAPDIKIIDQAIPSEEPLSPRYRVAMAVDPFGLVHLVVVRPQSPIEGSVDYWRETRVDGGGTTWLHDIVDEHAVGNDQDALVDLVVDDKARPHIAYRSGKDHKIRYATRYDR